MGASPGAIGLQDLVQIFMWKIDFCQICRWFVEGLRGVVGVFMGCSGGFVSVYEGLNAKIAILAVLEACGKASWGRSGRPSVHGKSIFAGFADGL